MWKNDEIQVYFSLFGASPEVLSFVKEENITQEDMDVMTMQSLCEIGISSKSVCSAMVSQWTTMCSHDKPLLALEAVEHAMESYGQILAYKADRNNAVYTNTKQDAVDPIKYGQLLRIIREQETRISELETNETAFIEELDKRANLVKELEAQVVDLEKLTQEKSLNTEEIKKYITQSHSLFHEQIDETQVNVRNIDQHVCSILKMAQHTVDIIEEEERKRGHMESSLSVNLNLNSRLIHIDQISIENLKKEQDKKHQIEVIGGVPLDPYVIFKLTDEAIETKKIHNSGPNPVWDHLNIELQALDDESNEEYNKMIVEVWDDFSMNLSNELICSGSISFTHLDLLNNRGPVMTTVDLMDSNGNLVTTAQIHINVIMGGTDVGRVGSALSGATTQAQYDIDNEVLCNYGGEGDWLPGKIIRYKKIRDRADTRRLYEVEFENGDLEVNVSISRLRDVVRKPSHKDKRKGGRSADSSSGLKENLNNNVEEETELAALFHSNNADLLEAITDVQTSSHGTIESIIELDEWQKKLTKLLSDALQRYFEINSSATKYSVYVNSLTEKIGNIEHFLQRIEISEQKSDDINADCENLRTEVEDLRKQLADMTHQRDQEQDSHTQTKHSLELEKEVTLECKKEIIDLRSELDHLIEVVRRDMSNRITSKNVNEELYSLSSKMVKTDMQAPDPAPPVTGNSNTWEHNDIFMQQHDWKLFLSLIKVDMTPQEVTEAHATLHNLNKSFEILSSRLLLECRHRADCEFKLTGAKENLREIKDDIITEATLRLQLEEEMQYFKEMSEKYKDEVEKHKQFSVIAKKAAYDAIKQARYFQRKLNIEIDNISDAGFGESKGSLNQDQKEQHLNGSGGNKKDTPQKNQKGSNKVLNLDEYDGLFDDTDDDVSAAGGGGGRRKPTRSTTGQSSGRRNPNSPYLHGRKKDRNNPYHNLQTRSENEKDYHASQASLSSKKSKKIKIPGKKQMSYVGKKITRVFFDGKGGSKSSAGITPFDDTSTTGKSTAKSPGKSWVNPGHVNYAQKYSKEPPTAASRRTYIPQQQYD